MVFRGMVYFKQYSPIIFLQKEMSNLQKRNKEISRRDFVNRTGALMGLGMFASSLNSLHFNNNMQQPATIKVKNVDSNFEREPLFPYHFKGSVITEAWQTAARLESESAFSSIGLGT